MALNAIQKKLLGLLGWLAVSFATAAVGGFASANAGDFYAQLIRPEWAPPGWLFAPVWSVLYVLMGVAAWLVWKERGFSAARTPLTLFLVQLVLNAAWTWLFFVWGMGFGAFVEIIILWALIVATLITFWRVRHLAGWMLMPYLVWVTFATCLTYATWQRNPALLG